MKTLLTTLILLLAIPSTLLGQERQAGFNFYTSASDSIAKLSQTYGGAVELTVPFKTRFVALGRGFFERYRDDNLGQIGHQRGLHGELRYYVPGAELIRGEYKIFISGGLSFRHAYVGQFENDYVSPTVGLGLNYEDRVVVQYFYQIPDLKSQFEESGSHVRADGYVPLAWNWNARLGVEYRRLRASQTGSPTINSLQGEIGVARRF